MACTIQILWSQISVSQRIDVIPWRSPSSSPPVVQKLFPLHSKDKNKEIDSVSISEEYELTIDQSPKDDGLCKFGLSNSGRRNDMHNIPLSYPPRGSDLQINGVNLFKFRSVPIKFKFRYKGTHKHNYFQTFWKRPERFSPNVEV